ncbi:MAG: DUF3696 domain-containing protein [Verrucomicrobia bacterium]|nr:DUF3696 domain-containing protein [Verrucomicrobiota bacterium]
MSHLTAFSIQNFKAFRDEQRIPIRPITLVYGQNSAGKSSLIDAVLLLHHLATHGAPKIPFSRFDPYQGEYFDFSVTGNSVRLGKVWDFVHGKAMSDDNKFFLGCVVSDKETTARMEFGFDNDGLFSFQQFLGEEPWMFRLNVKRRSVGFLSDHFAHVEVNSEHPAFRAAVAGALAEIDTKLKIFAESAPDSEAGKAVASYLKECDFSIPEFREDLANEVAAQYSRLRLNARSIPPEPVTPLTHPVLEQHPTFAESTDRPEHTPDWSDRESSIDMVFEESFSSYVEGRIIKLAVDIAVDRLEGLRCPGNAVASEALESVAYCGPQRADLDLESMFPPQIQHEDESGVNIGGWALDDAALEFVNGWLQAQRFGTAHYAITKNSEAISVDTFSHAVRVELSDLGRGISVGLHEVGSGLGQIVPVLLAAAAYQNHLVCVKQPELHLHPSLQADVADVFAKFAGRTSEPTGSRFLIETHSEHLLLRLMRRIRESTHGKLKKGERPLCPDDVAVLYVENLGTHSVVREMPLNENGELARDWPGGFFEEGLREVLM